jgi:UDP-2,3-diacylglucosamine pyrophosphatase LpxH
MLQRVHTDPSFSHLDTASLPMSEIFQAHEGRRFKFQTKINKEGRKTLFFPFASVSDVHWGTRASRAKRLCHLLHNTMFEVFHCLGDMIDGEYLRKKPTWKMAVWHRQGQAHLLKKSDQGEEVIYFVGNHEDGLRERIVDKNGNPKDVSFLGIKIVDTKVSQDNKGRKILDLHGDIFDEGAFNSDLAKPVMFVLKKLLGSEDAAKKYIYDTLGSAYESLYAIDTALNSLPYLDDFSLAAIFKKCFKETLNKHMDVKKVVSQALDDSPYDVMRYGHSHIKGFDWTPGGKLLVNDGCCTEHVNMLAQDENGTMALLTWRKNGIEIIEEPLSPEHKSVEYFMTWEELGVDHFHEAVSLMDNQYTARADRLLRLVYRMWSPQDRSEIVQKKRQAEALADVAKYSPDLIPDSLVLSFYQGGFNKVPDLMPVPITRPNRDQMGLSSKARELAA